MIEKVGASLSDLPLEIIALVLELIDYRSLASFEIALPSAAQVLGRRKKKRLRLEIRKSDLFVNNQFAVRYHRAIASLEWIKRRTQLSTLHVTYTAQALRHFKRKLDWGKLNSPSLNQYMKIVKFIDLWSKDAIHFIADIYPSYLPDQIGLFSCLPTFIATDSITIKLYFVPITHESNIISI